MSLEERFTKIVREMDAELTDARKEIAELKSQLNIANFSQQATKCGKCGEYKHTPWKDDEYGYLCVGCLVKIKDEEIRDLRNRCKKSF